MKRNKNNKLLIIALVFILLRTFFAMVWDLGFQEGVDHESTLAPVVFASETRSLVTPSAIPTATNTPLPTATFTPTFTPTATPHPANILGFGPNRWSRTDADLAFEKGDMQKGFTQVVRPAIDGTISVNMYSPDLPFADEYWLGGKVSGVWPVDFDNRAFRILGECSHPCDIFLVDLAGNIIDQQNAGHIDIIWPAGKMDEGWIVIKPTSQSLDRVAFRVGPFENPAIESLEYKPGHALFGFVKPVGRAQYYLQEGILNSFSTTFKRSDLGVLESDQIVAYYIIPMNLQVGDYDVKIWCWHTCDIRFINQYGNEIRQTVHMQWTEENQGIYQDLIGVPADSGSVQGWIVIQQTNWSGPEIGVSIEIK